MNNSSERTQLKLIIETIVNILQPFLKDKIDITEYDVGFYGTISSLDSHSLFYVAESSYRGILINKVGLTKLPNYEFLNKQLLILAKKWGMASESRIEIVLDNKGKPFKQYTKDDLDFVVELF
jgi:hypothetical protein